MPSLAVGLLLMPLVSTQARTITDKSDFGNEMTECLSSNLQQKKVVKKTASKKTAVKRVVPRKTPVKNSAKGKLDGQITVNGVQIDVTATGSMLMIIYNDENMSPNSVNFEGKIEDIRCYNNSVYIKSNVTDEYEQRFTFFNVYKYDLVTNKSELLLESCNDVKFDDTKHVIHTATIASMGLNGATYDKQDIKM